MLRLAEKAFRPARFPFPLLHIDTGHNFPEVIEFRDRRAAQLGERLIVRTVQDAIEAGIATEPAAPIEAATGCRFQHCSAQLKSSSSTPLLVGHDATRKRHALRRESFLFVMSSVSGTHEINAQSCGISTTQGYLRASISASFHYPTGLSSTYGSTSSAKVWKSRVSILPMKEKCSSVKACG